MGDLEYEKPLEGAWFVYTFDWSAQPEALFTDELEARRYSASRPYTEVCFWPFNTEWTEVDK